MSEAQRGSVTVYWKHDWDLETSTAATEDSSPLKCSRCQWRRHHVPLWRRNRVPLTG